jgi:hypothetical protein
VDGSEDTAPGEDGAQEHVQVPSEQTGSQGSQDTGDGPIHAAGRPRVSRSTVGELQKVTAAAAGRRSHRSRAAKRDLVAKRLRDGFAPRACLASVASRTTLDPGIHL